MHSNHLDAGLFSCNGQGHRIFVRLAPTGAHLQSDRHAMGGTGRHHGRHDGHRQRLVLHQGGPSPFVTDLLGRATHVDVNDLGATVDVVARCIGHHARLGSSDLHRNRAWLTIVVGPARGLGRVP